MCIVISSSDNKALVLIRLGLHMHNLGDLRAALENLGMALDINPDDKDALHMKALLTQVLTNMGTRNDYQMFLWLWPGPLISVEMVELTTHVLLLVIICFGDELTVDITRTGLLFDIIFVTN